MRSNYLAILTEQAWSKRDLLLWPQRELFIAGPTQEIPSGWYRPILPHCGSQLLAKHRIRLILPVSNSAIIYTCNNKWTLFLHFIHKTHCIFVSKVGRSYRERNKGTAKKLLNLKKSTIFFGIGCYILTESKNLLISLLGHSLKLHSFVSTGCP